MVSACAVFAVFRIRNAKQFQYINLPGWCHRKSPNSVRQIDKALDTNTMCYEWSATPCGYVCQCSIGHVCVLFTLRCESTLNDCWLWFAWFHVQISVDTLRNKCRSFTCPAMEETQMSKYYCNFPKKKRRKFRLVFVRYTWSTSAWEIQAIYL